jgi:hypothetical protein
MRPLAVTVASVLTCLGIAAEPSAVLAQKWGNVKGQITLEGAIPAPDEIEFKPDQCPCQKKGEKLYRETWVVNKDNKGLKNVVVWLTDDPDLKASKPTNLPIHPALANVKVPPTVEFDQPCCAFEPHVLVMRPNQKVVVKNSAPFAHNVRYSGKGRDANGKDIINLEGNETVQPEKSFTLSGFIPYFSAVDVSCSIHPWMKAWVRVIDHPYYAITDKDGKFEIPNAPAGDYYLEVWHEAGAFHDFVPKPGGGGTLYGKKITIKDAAKDGDTEVNLSYKSPEQKKD